MQKYHKQEWLDGWKNNPYFLQETVEYIVMIIFRLFYLIKIKNKIFSYYTEGTVVCWVSDCKTLIFASNSFLRSLATRLTVGLGTPNSSTTFV